MPSPKLRLVVEGIQVADGTGAKDHQNLLGLRIKMNRAWGVWGSRINDWANGVDGELTALHGGKSLPSWCSNWVKPMLAMTVALRPRKARRSMRGWLGIQSPDVFRGFTGQKENGLR